MESPKELSKPKVAIVHDFLTYWGGAEQVLLSLHHIYPDAPIYTLLYDKKMDEYFPNARIRVSFLGKLPNFLKKRKKFTALNGAKIQSMYVVAKNSVFLVK